MGPALICQKVTSSFVFPSLASLEGGNAGHLVSLNLIPLGIYYISFSFFFFLATAGHQAQEFRKGREQQEIRNIIDRCTPAAPKRKVSSHLIYFYDDV